MPKDNTTELLAQRVDAIAIGWATMEVHREALSGLLRGMVVQDLISMKVIRIEGVRIDHGRVWLYGPVATARSWHRRRRESVSLRHAPTLKFMTQKEYWNERAV